MREKFEDTKGVIRICILVFRKENRQYNGKRKKDEKSYNDLQNTTQKPKNLATGIPLKTGGKLKCSGRDHSSCSTCGTRRVTLNANCVNK